MDQSPWRPLLSEITSIRAIPEALLLGPVVVGQRVVRRVAIRSRSGRLLRVEEVETESEVADVRLLPTSKQEVCEILLTVPVRQLGAQRTTVTVRVPSDRSPSRRTARGDRLDEQTGLDRHAALRPPQCRGAEPPVSRVTWPHHFLSRSQP